jgi:hypothetical protein
MLLSSRGARASGGAPPVVVPVVIGGSSSVLPRPPSLVSGHHLRALGFHGQIVFCAPGLCASHSGACRDDLL